MLSKYIDGDAFEFIDVSNNVGIKSVGELFECMSDDGY